MTLTPFMSLDNGDDANVTRISAVTHMGTHVDAPSHVIRGGNTITDYRADEFVFRAPVMLDLPLHDDEVVMPEHLRNLVDLAGEADLILIRFGYGGVRSGDPQRYSGHCPGFGTESAAFLIENFPKMRALGMDVPSLSCIKYLAKTMKAHNILLGTDGRRFLILEDMNLDQDLHRLDMVIAGPWLIRGMDGGPATIIGRLRD
jgi:kynurenine formamidase